MSLILNEKDFSEIMTYDEILVYYTKKYPNDWMERSYHLFGMSVEELGMFYQKRLDNWNR